MKKLLIFDYDGVIADSLDIMWECFDKVNKKHNFFPFKNKNELTTIWNENFFEYVAKVKISPLDLAKFLKRWDDLVMLNNEKVKSFFGLKPILKKLSQDNHLIIISSNTYKVMNNFLKRDGLFDCFNLILGEEEGKSKRKKLKLVLKKFKIPKDMIYFITDTIGDLKEVKGFGIKTVAVTWGYHDKNKLQKENPDFLVESPKELLELFL